MLTSSIGGPLCDSIRRDRSLTPFERRVPTIQIGRSGRPAVRSRQPASFSEP